MYAESYTTWLELAWKGMKEIDILSVVLVTWMYKIYQSSLNSIIKLTPGLSHADI